MGVVDAVKKMFGGGKSPSDKSMASDPNYVDVPSWTARIYSAQRLAEIEWPAWRSYEMACDGKYPSVIAPSAEDLFSSLDYAGLTKSGDQIEPNVMGRALRHKISEAYGRFITLDFKVSPTTDTDVVEAMKRLALKLMDEGDAVTQERRAMELAYTRGQAIVFPLFIRDRIPETEVVASKTSAADFVESVLHGNPPQIPVGADYAGIIVAVKQPLSPITPDGKDNPQYYALSEQQKYDLTLLQMRAEKMQRQTTLGPHALTLRSKLNYECTPYLSFCLTDAGVTDFSKVTFIARKIVMTPEEFQADPTFTDEAKREIRPQPRPKSDGGAPTSPDIHRTYDGKTVADEEGRVVLWEIWDKIGWRRIYIALGYGKQVGKSTRYPYMDMYGRPLFPDFFPCVWRTPWSRQTETPARVLGLPGIEPMYALQIELIKTLSAFVLAAKSTARIFLVGPNIDQSTLTGVARAQDCTFVKFTAESSASASVPPVGSKIADQFSQIQMGQAPKDYLDAAMIVERKAYEMVGITSAAMTGDPQAGTATQEGMIQQGAATTSGDVKATFEDMHAELAWKSLLLFLEFANPQEFEAYLGPEALQPRPSLDPPTMDPATGQMVPGPMRPSIMEAMQMTDLIGERLEAHFDSSTRNANFQKQKTDLDLLATVDKVRDELGRPFADPVPVMRRVFENADMQFVRYKPSPDVIAAQMQAQANGQEEQGEKGKSAPGPGNSSSPADGSDGRIAGGERGAPNSPGQHNTRMPNGHIAQANASGAMLREGNATH